MRCVLRVSLVVLLAAMPAAAFAQSPVCHPVRRGESATQVARRVTGDARNAYQAWFQIMNPSSKFVPKSQYNRIRPGWLACVIKPSIQSASWNRNHARTPSASNLTAVPDASASDAVGAAEVPDSLSVADTSAASDSSLSSEVPAPLMGRAIVGVTERTEDKLRSTTSDVLRMIGAVDLTMVWLGAAMAVPWFGWRFLDDYFARRRTTSIVMQHFAHRFVSEFERPLLRDDHGERPVRSRYRRGARRGRFEILLAPGEGRRYPNLSDHKKNVEYDVARVMHVLGDASFVNGPLHAHGEWVVVPLQFLVRRSFRQGENERVSSTQPGVTCISSF